MQRKDGKEPGQRTRNGLHRDDKAGNGTGRASRAKAAVLALRREGRRQYCKLMRDSEESVEEWKGRMRVKVTDCKYKEVDGRLKEQSINHTKHQTMTTDI